MARVIPITPDAMVLDDAPQLEGARLRVPPHSVEAEHGVLGAIMQWPTEAMQAASEALCIADFYRHEHRLIYGAASDLAGRGVEPDMISGFEELAAWPTSTSWPAVSAATATHDVTPRSWQSAPPCGL